LPHDFEGNAEAEKIQQEWELANPVEENKG